MAKARGEGPRYIYTLLTSYYEKEANVYDNKLFHGIKMPDPLGYSVATTDKEKADIEAKAKDIVAFLTWSSDPQAEERKSLGIYVIGYLFILSILLGIITPNKYKELTTGEDNES